MNDFIPWVTPESGGPRSSHSEVLRGSAHADVIQGRGGNAADCEILRGLDLDVMRTSSSTGVGAWYGCRSGQIPDIVAFALCA